MSKEISLKEKMKNLKVRADKRRENLRSVKSAEDVKIENQNATDLINYVYNQMEGVKWN